MRSEYQRDADCGTVAGSMSIEEDLQFAVDLARSAGAIARLKYGKVTRLTKTHRATQNEAVTEADRECQRHIVAALRGRFPNDGIVGEESDTGNDITFDVAEPNARAWVIDPIDGTNNFVAGMDNFAVCIGLLDRGQAVLGVVYDVTRDRVYRGATGVGAFVDEKPALASTESMGDAAMLMLTSNMLDASGHCPAWADWMLRQTTWKLRMLGSAALECVAVAAGTAGAAITVNGKLWDCVAPCAIVLAAGGIVTDLKGNPIFPFTLANYGGAKVPYLAAGTIAHGQVLSAMVGRP